MFAGFRFPREVISAAVCWHLRSGLSSRDVGELLAERGITAGHGAGCRWVRRCTAEFIEAARPGRHVPGNRWLAEETYLRGTGRRADVYRAADQRGQVIDVLASAHRDLAAARRFFTSGAAHRHDPRPRSPPAARDPPVIGEPIPAARPTVGQHANNPAEAGHGRRTARLRPLRRRTRHRSARILTAGHAFAPNLRRGHYDIARDGPARHRLRIAFDDLATAI